MIHFAPSKPTRLTPARSLQAMGTLGAVMAMAILAMSVLLRLTTVFAADGATSSNLPTAVEDVARLIHRLSASGVGLLALLASVVCWRHRRAVPNAVMPVALIAASTVMLALIGPLTAGYRFTAVTVANVVGGTMLLASCWWLRETLAAMAPRHPVDRPLLTAMLIVFFVHVTTGAATSALNTHGITRFAAIHQASAMLTIVLLGAILWDSRHDARLSRLFTTMKWLLGAQIALGLTAMWPGAQAPWFALLHALVSPLLAAGLVSVAVRGAPTQPGPVR